MSKVHIRSIIIIVISLLLAALLAWANNEASLRWGRTLL